MEYSIYIYGGGKNPQISKTGQLHLPSCIRRLKNSWMQALCLSTVLVKSCYIATNHIVSAQDNYLTHLVAFVSELLSSLGVGEC